MNILNLFYFKINPKNIDIWLDVKLKKKREKDCDNISNVTGVWYSFCV